MIQYASLHKFNIKRDPYLRRNQTTAFRHHNMDNRLPEVAMCIPTISTRGLLLSKPQPHYPLLTSSKINGVERESSAVSKNHGFGPKLIEMIKHKLTYGSKIVPLGRGGKIFDKRFSIRDGERLLHASRCSIYTTAGAISGILFISTERVSFCSDRSLKTYSTTGKLLKFQYKVSIPLKKIDGVGEITNLKRPSNMYMELVTVDNFSFWFLGFPNYKKTVECLRQTISHDCLSD
ncbi:putative GEM-like protein [Helianthus annuus]|nr:putative GEM-like protein [Helianthus annuus]KAJ0812078.1 putative GEM-like protein [Helianthus annuus]